MMVDPATACGVLSYLVAFAVVARWFARRSL
jgi:hypothetical protein